MTTAAKPRCRFELDDGDVEDVGVPTPIQVEQALRLSPAQHELTTLRWQLRIQREKNGSGHDDAQHCTRHRESARAGDRHNVAAGDALRTQASRDGPRRSYQLRVAI